MVSKEFLGRFTHVQGVPSDFSHDKTTTLVRNPEGPISVCQLQFSCTGIKVLQNMEKLLNRGQIEMTGSIVIGKKQCLGDLLASS